MYYPLKDLLLFCSVSSRSQFLVGKHIHAAPVPGLPKSISCRSHTGLGDRSGPQESKWVLPFFCGQELCSTLPQKKEFSRWLKQADIPAASCHLPSSQVSSQLLLALLGKQSPLKEGRAADCSKLLLWEGSVSALLLSPVSLLVHRIWGQI